MQKSKRKNISKEEIINKLSPLGRAESFIRKFHSGPFGKRMAGVDMIAHRNVISEIRSRGEAQYKKLVEDAAKEMQPLNDELKKIGIRYDALTEAELLKHMNEEVSYIENTIIPILNNK